MKKEYSYLLSCITIIVLIIGFAFSKNSFVNNEQTLKVKQNTYQNANQDIIDGGNVVAASVTVPLTINNKQNDEVENEYKYYITVNEVSGAIETKINDKTEYIVFNAKGEAEFTLKNNFSITFLNLPMDVEFTIKQEKLEGYTTKINNVNNNEYNGTLSVDNNVTFENINPTGEKNPQTVDNIIYVFVALLFITTIIIALKNIKLKKYNV